MKNLLYPVFSGSLFFLLFLAGCKKTPDNPHPEPPSQRSHGSLKGAGNYCLGNSINGSYYVDTIMNASNYIDVVVNANVPGTYAISTDTVNGIYFNANGSFSAIGIDTIRLKGNGTPVNAGNHVYNIKYDSSYCTVSITAKKFYSPLNTVYVGGTDNTLYALDAATGNIKWNFLTGYYIGSAPTFAGNRVYVGSYDNNLYAIDATTDTLVWKYSCNLYPYNSYVEKTPVFLNGSLYFTSANGKLYATDTSARVINGVKYPNARWSTVVEGIGSGSLSPAAAANGLVYVADRTDNFYAFDMATGTLKWKQLMPSGGEGSNPVVNGNLVYAWSDEGIMYAFNASTGSKLWEASLDKGGGRHTSSPTLYSGILYVGTDSVGFATNQIGAIDASTGATKWKTKMTAEAGFLSSGIVVANGLIYAASDNGFVYAWDLTTGNMKWKYDTGSPIYYGPTVTGNAVYVTNDAGNILSIQSQTGILNWTKKPSQYFKGAGVCVVDATGNVYHPSESGETN